MLHWVAWCGYIHDVWGNACTLIVVAPAARGSVPIDISRNYTSVSQHPSQPEPVLPGTRHLRTDQTKGTAAMSEDRPADDRGDGVNSAVGLSSDALADLVRLASNHDYGLAKLMLINRQKIFSRTPFPASSRA